MHRGHCATPRYTGQSHGHWGDHGHHPHHHHGQGGFCQSCCHPVSQCCCHVRDCRKEAKELLVEPTLTANDLKQNARFATEFSNMAAVTKLAAVSAASTGVEGKSGAEEAKSAEAFSELSFNSVRDVEAIAVNARLGNRFGLDKAFIGGGCCVHLSIEYAPSVATAASLVGVLVTDSEGTTLLWAKRVEPGTGYQICEGILATKPGANLAVVVVNMTARVRWCEVFSC